jgi:hypothetical protein
VDRPAFVQCSEVLASGCKIAWRTDLQSCTPRRRSVRAQSGGTRGCTAAPRFHCECLFYEHGREMSWRDRIGRGTPCMSKRLDASYRSARPHPAAPMHSFSPAPALLGHYLSGVPVKEYLGLEPGLPSETQTPSPALPPVILAEPAQSEVVAPAVHDDALSPSFGFGGTHDHVICVKGRIQPQSGRSAKVSSVPVDEIARAIGSSG